MGGVRRQPVGWSRIGGGGVRVVGEVEAGCGNEGEGGDDMVLFSSEGAGRGEGGELGELKLQSSPELLRVWSRASESYWWTKDR